MSRKKCVRVPKTQEWYLEDEQLALGGTYHFVLELKHPNSRGGRLHVRWSPSARRLALLRFGARAEGGQCKPQHLVEVVHLQERLPLDRRAGSHEKCVQLSGAHEVQVRIGHPAVAAAGTWNICAEEFVVHVLYNALVHSMDLHLQYLKAKALYQWWRRTQWWAEAVIWVHSTGGSRACNRATCSADTADTVGARRTRSPRGTSGTRWRLPASSSRRRTWRRPAPDPRCKRPTQRTCASPARAASTRASSRPLCSSLAQASGTWCRPAKLRHRSERNVDSRKLCSERKIQV